MSRCYDVARIAELISFISKNVIEENLQNPDQHDQNELFENGDYYEVLLKFDRQLLPEGATVDELKKAFEVSQPRFYSFKIDVLEFPGCDSQQIKVDLKVTFGVTEAFSKFLDRWKKHIESQPQQVSGIPARHPLVSRHDNIPQQRERSPASPLRRVVYRGASAAASSAHLWRSTDTRRQPATSAEVRRNSLGPVLQSRR